MGKQSATLKSEHPMHGGATLPWRGVMGSWQVKLGDREAPSKRSETAPQRERQRRETR